MVAANIANLRFAKQTAKGAPAAASAYGLLLAGGDQVHPARTDESFAETTSAQMRSDRYVSEVHTEGAPQFYVMPKSIGALAYGVLGGATVTGAGDPYAHAIVRATTLPYWTFWRMLANLIWERFDDCKITKLVIHGESGKPLTATATILGIRPRAKTAAETTAAVEITQRFMHYNGAGALLLEGVAHPFRNFDLTIDRNGQVTPGDALTPEEIDEGEMTVTLRATTRFASAALRSRLFYGSATPADNADAVNEVLELAGGGVSLLFTRVAAATPPERSLGIVIPRVAVQPFELQPSTGSEVLTSDITYNALQPADGSTPITVTVKNGQAASYAA